MAEAEIDTIDEHIGRFNIADNVNTFWHAHFIEILTEHLPGSQDC